MHGDYTLLFCGVQQRNARKFVLHVQHEYFSFLTNNFLLCGVVVVVAVFVALTP